jgi:hypothetical protein
MLAKSLALIKYWCPVTTDMDSADSGLEALLTRLSMLRHVPQLF